MKHLMIALLSLISMSCSSKTYKNWEDIPCTGFVKENRYSDKNSLFSIELPKFPENPTITEIATSKDGGDFHFFDRNGGFRLEVFRTRPITDNVPGVGEAFKRVFQEVIHPQIVQNVPGAKKVHEEVFMFGQKETHYVVYLLPLIGQDKTIKRGYLQCQERDLATLLSTDEDHISAILYQDDSSTSYNHLKQKLLNIRKSFKRKEQGQTS